MSLRKLVNFTTAWGYDKNICNPANIDKQLLKTIEESGELYEALMNNNRDEAIDAVGDTTVTLILAMECLNFINIDGLIDKATTEPELLSDYVSNVSAEIIIANMSINVSKMVEVYLKRHSLEDEVLRNHIYQLIKMLNTVALEIGTTLEHCLQTAYDVISQRTGTTTDGVFLKESANGL